MVKYAMAIDLDRCMGCRACMEACKIENNTGRNIFWMFVFKQESGEYPNTTTNYMPRPCMHCDNAPCVKVCPVGARFKSETGAVLTDFDRCVGCRYCEVSCPYGVNYFNWREPADNQYYHWGKGEAEGKYGTADIRTLANGSISPYRNPTLDEPHGAEKRTVAGGGHYVGVIEKCTFCVQRTDKGLDPACVANCPVSVYTFGDLDDPNSSISKLLASRSSFRLLEETNTHPRVYYLGTPMPLEHRKHLENISV
ncbi:MAG: 4Fe-4S dicluster domain-containing protein [Thaumarchaeota archaeon]|nr:4Fe-4S dicluster domain-containing protein [Nitrososphaerota archaeon]